MKITYSSLFKHLKYQCKISPNNNYVANLVENRLVIRRNELDLTVTEVHTLPGPLDYLQWSPDSEYILAVNYNRSRIEIRSVIDSRWKSTIYDEGFPFIKVLWSPDSKCIFCFSELNLRLSVWKLSEEKQIYIDHLKFSDRGFEVSPDKKYIAIIEKNNAKEYIGIYQCNSLLFIQRFELETIDVENLKWSPNSMYITVWENPLYHKLLVYRRDGRLCMDYSGDEFGLGIRTVQWSPNSKILALGNYDDSIHLLSTASWGFIGPLLHPSFYSSSTGPNILEEVKVTKTTIPTSSLSSNTDIEYNQIFNRPFQIPIRRPEYNAANPKVGINPCLFSPNGIYLCSRSDTMPSALFIWDMKTLSCLHIIIFREYIRQFVWNPELEYTVTVICGDENMHFIDLDPKNHTLDITVRKIPTNNFDIKKIKWDRHGISLLMMEKDLFCLALLK